MVELLECAQRERATVEVVVSDCLYACCAAKRWVPRTGYEQTYRGVINDVDVAADRFVLHAIALGALNYAVAGRISALSDVAFVD